MHISKLMKLRDQRGCAPKSTFYISIQHTICSLVKGLHKGLNEIATHTVDHIGSPPLSQIKGAKDYLAGTCGIPHAEIQGFRSPFLSWNNNSLHNVRDADLMYDSTIVPTDYGVNGQNFGTTNLWPFTLGEQSNIDAFKGVGTGSITPKAGLWEVPMWPLFSPTNGTLIPMDYPIDAATLTMNLLRRYNGNRAPLGLFFHASWLQQRGAMFENWISEIMSTYPDVYFVTVQDVLKWMRNPVPKQQYQNSCVNQVTDCLPPNGNCLFGSFNADECLCQCTSPYCRDSSGACTLAGIQCQSSTTSGGGSNGGSSGNPAGTCCPNGMTGYRTYNNCTQYYRCTSGNVLGSVSSCPPGLLFDAKVQVCNWASLVTTCIVDTCNAAPASTPVQTQSPAVPPTSNPATVSPTMPPSTIAPKIAATNNATPIPSKRPASFPISQATVAPTRSPTKVAAEIAATKNPTPVPSKTPTSVPTHGPTISPTYSPITVPTTPHTNPTFIPSTVPAKEPPSQTTNAPVSSPTEPCCPPGFTGYRASSSTCTGFVHCSKGVPVGNRLCASGLLFSSAIMQCDWAWRVTSCGYTPC